MDYNKKIIEICPSVHGTANVYVYNMPSMKIIDLFSLLDIWGSKGYEYTDGGLYFELPLDVAKTIPNMPFVSHNGITVKFN